MRINGNNFKQYSFVKCQYRLEIWRANKYTITFYRDGIVRKNT